MVPPRQGPVPPRRLRGLRAGVHPPYRPRRERDLGLPADGAGAGGRLADGQPTASSRRARLTMMGGPIDARRAPTKRQQPGHRTRATNWFEHQRDLPRAAELPRRDGRRVYPGFLQHTGFVAMNPDRHAKSHYDYFLDLVRGDERQAPTRTASSTTSTTPCSTCRPSTTSTRSRPCSRTLRSSTAPGKSRASSCGRRTSRRSALLTIEGELDDISGAGQTRAAHDLCTGVAEGAPVPLRRRRCRPLRHLLRPPLARAGLPRGAKLHRPLPPGGDAPVAAPRRASRRRSRRNGKSARAKPASDDVTRVQASPPGPCFDSPPIIRR